MEQKSIYLERSSGTYEARFWHDDELRYFRATSDDPREAVRKLARSWGIDRYRVIRTDRSTL